MTNEKKTFSSRIDSYFGITAAGSTIKTEIMAGLTTFMAMVYILMVNANMFADPFSSGVNVLGVTYEAMYITTALSAIIGTVLIGLLAGLPLAQAPGMGLNAFFVYTMCVGFGFTYANALVFILIDGIVFIILTVTGLRKAIFNAIPDAVKKAIPAGIGLFIAFLGMQNAKWVIPSTSTGVTMGSLNLLTEGNWANAMPVIVTIIGVIAIAAMSKKNVKGAIVWGILGSALVYYLLGLTTGMYENFSVTLSNPFDAFGEFSSQTFGKVFTEGFNFAPYIDKNGMANFILMVITSSLSFCLVDMFDTIGTLYGACSRGNMLTESGDVPNMNKAMLADAVATTIGAVLGTSTVTTFVESSAGVAEGGRTRLTAYVVALLFAVAMFLSPIAKLIPSCATATALVYVGVLMMNCVREIEWTDPAVALPSFLTIACMAFTYNISFGIGLGLIAYVFIKLFTGKIKEVSVPTYVLTAIFIAMFLLTH